MCFLFLHPPPPLRKVSCRGATEGLAFLSKHCKHFCRGDSRIAHRTPNFFQPPSAEGMPKADGGRENEKIKIFLKNLLSIPTSKLPLSFLYHNPHSRFFTKLRSKKYTQGKLFSEFSKTFFVPTPRFLSFSKLFSVPMQTASYLFTVKKHEKRTTCTTRNSKRSPSFGHISHTKKELKKIFKIFEKISKKGLTF